MLPRFSTSLFSALALIVICASNAHAASETYDVNATIAGGGTLTGSFSLNSADAVTALSLAASGGNGYLGQNFTLSDPSYGFFTGPENGFVSNSPIVGSLTVASGFGTSASSVILTFLYPQGGAITQFGPGSYFYENSNIYLLSGNVTEVSNVPLPASLPMFAAALLGMLGLGLLWKSRRACAIRSFLPA